MGTLRIDKHELFAINLAKGMGQAKAYADAGYKPNDGAASRLAGSVKIINRVAELRSRMITKVTLTKHYVIEATLENAEKALGRRPVKVSRRIGDKYEEADVFVYEGQIANAALKMLGNEIGIFHDKKDVRIVNEYDKLSDVELAAELEGAAQRLLESNMKVIEHDGGEGDD